jgi:peptide/nickel transport system permease protein
MATGIGLVLGLIAGLFGGWVDTAIMRTTDAVLAIPALIAIAIVAGVVGTGLGIVVLVIGLFGWTEAARVVRATVLSLREQDFVTAARALGGRNLWIIRRHLLFHALAPLTVTGTFTVAGALLTEAALSYLGIGVTPPTPSWGNMLYDAQQLFILRDYPWYWVPPGLAIFVAVLAVNLVGDGLRDALDPHG